MTDPPNGIDWLRVFLGPARDCSIWLLVTLQLEFSVLNPIGCLCSAPRE